MSNDVHKPYSEACERNKAPIFEVLSEVFTAPGLILEIGSGTGQHAAHFAAGLPHLVWQPSDLALHLPGIRAWIAAAGLDNLRDPIVLDVGEVPWPVTQAQGVFSANTAHILGWPQVRAMFAGVGRVLGTGGSFCLYGPFHRHGRASSDSNARFDAMLRARDPASGVRDIDDLEQLAARNGLALVGDHPMPANNSTLVWQRA